MRGTGFTGPGRRRGVTTHRRTISALALVGACVLFLAATQTASAEPAAETVDTGFVIPFAGVPGYERLAPTQMTSPDQLNQPLGQQKADEIAAQIGFNSADALSEQQYRDLVTGGGVGGSRDAAEMIDTSILILTNTIDHPLYFNADGHPTPSVLASYGLYVNTGGLLESPANADAPTRQVNSLIAPGGFVGTWMRNNGAAQTLIALYRSAYTVQLPFGIASQQMSGTAQLVTNTKGGSEFAGGHVDGADDLDSELRSALHFEALPGGRDARLLGSHSVGGCRRDSVEPHRSGSFQRLCVLLPVIRIPFQGAATRGI